MKKMFANNVFMILIIATFMVGAGVYTAYAHGPGGGYQGNYGPMMGGWGMGPGMMGGSGHYGHGCQYGGYGPMMGNLTDDEIQQIDKQCSAFWKSTEDLRQKLYQKELALQSEFAKENIDTQKAEDLQKEISRLQSQIDQKRIDHMIEMRKINPNVGRGFMGSGGMGSGMGGYCWK